MAEPPQRQTRIYNYLLFESRRPNIFQPKKLPKFLCSFCPQPRWWTQTRICKHFQCCRPRKVVPVLPAKSTLFPLRQPHICEFLGRQCSPGFMHLTPSIRYQIYIYAGIKVRKPATVWHVPRYGSQIQGLEDGYYQNPRRVTISLLLTCKTIFREVQKAIYAQNLFFIRFSYCGIPWLRNLPSEAYAGLTFLSVRLDAFADQGTVSYDLIQQWQSALDRLLVCTSPRTLTLRVLYNGCRDDAFYLYMLLKPLLQHPGVLKSIGLRLWRNKTENRTQLDRFVSKLMMKIMDDHAEDPFPFFRLPPELRFEILTHTELVTPSRMIHFSENDRFHALCINRDCRSLNPYTAYAPSCRCFASPQAYFLVNRAMYHEAMRVMVTQNCFIIFQPFWWCNGAIEWHILPIKESSPLKELITRGTGPGPLLESLEFILTGCLCPHSDHPVQEIDSARDSAVRYWEEAVEIIRRSAISRIIVRLAKVEGQYREDLLMKGPLSIWETFGAALREGLIGPLGKLVSGNDGDLRQFFVFLTEMSPPPYNVKSVMQRDRILKEVEAQLERMVLGEHYDARSAGKDSVSRREWSH
ncbi:hypothetical protein F5Y16DRAFT_138343 [Xylariaceae sp. FL0255]|nr:hypothetical protein F5Y16DRAFT_138343 [Xylariaceae sp. FL0255]